MDMTSDTVIAFLHLGQSGVSGNVLYSVIRSLLHCTRAIPPDIPLTKKAVVVQCITLRKHRQRFLKAEQVPPGMTERPEMKKRRADNRRPAHTQGGTTPPAGSLVARPASRGCAARQACCGPSQRRAASRSLSPRVPCNAAPCCRCDT